MAEKHLWICDNECYTDDEGNLVVIKGDYYCENPRKEFDGYYSNFYTWLRSYDSPDDAPGEVEDLFADFDLDEEWESVNCDVEERNHRLIEAYNAKLEDYKQAVADVRHRIETNKSLNEAHRLVDNEWVDENFFEFFEGDPFAFPTAPKKPTLKSYPNPLTWFVGKLNELGHIALPVSAYIHGGIVYDVGSPEQFPDSQWDAGYAGLIYATCEDIKENLMVEVADEVRESVVKMLADEVEYYSEWAEGHTYGYIKYDKDGDEVDSCWGFIGDDAYKSGLADYAGDLHECEWRSLDEYVEAHEGKRIYTGRIVKTGERTPALV